MWRSFLWRRVVDSWRVWVRGRSGRLGRVRSTGLQHCDIVELVGFGAVSRCMGGAVAEGESLGGGGRMLLRLGSGL
jgi:hypothetical protein